MVSYKEKCIALEERYDNLQLKIDINRNVMHNLIQYNRNKDRKNFDHKKKLKSAKEIDKKRYWFIPQSYEMIINALTWLKKELKPNYNDTKTFVDAGCGMGWVVYLARQYGFKSYGIEWDKSLCEVAKSIYGSPYSSGELGNRIINDDILEQNYSKYDVIYYYCPINDGKLETKFERKIAREMKVGAYIIECPTCSDKQLKKFKHVHHYPSIYKRIKK